MKVVLFIYLVTFSYAEASGLYGPSYDKEVEAQKKKVELEAHYKNISKDDLLKELVAFYVQALSDFKKFNSQNYLSINCNDEYVQGISLQSLDRMNKALSISKLDSVGISVLWSLKVESKLSPIERALVKKFPDDGKKVVYLAHIATNKAEQMFPRDGDWGGERDAFRHAYWNALLVKYVNVDFAKIWTTAHEMEPGDKSYGKFDYNNTDLRMDMLNNNIGRVIGKIYAKESDDQIAKIIKEEIEKGRLYKIAEKVDAPDLVPTGASR